jgi:hypothetical protein
MDGRAHLPQLEPRIASCSPSNHLPVETCTLEMESKEETCTLEMGCMWGKEAICKLEKGCKWGKEETCKLGKERHKEGSRRQGSQEEEGSLAERAVWVVGAAPAWEYGP